MSIGMFRYPGGKSKIRKIILSRIGNPTSYCEPFFGGGSIGLYLLDNPNIKQIIINDKDEGIAALWTSIINYPETLKQEIKSFIPTTNSFYHYKQALLDHQIKDIFSLGFAKLVIHQLSYSGLGTKSGGPLGGPKQLSQYKINCRWSSDYLCKKIDVLRDKLIAKQIQECTSYDFEDVIADNASSFFYLDPPYFEKGPQLYQYSFTLDDHYRLALILRANLYTNRWLLSYDDHPKIRELYGDWANIEEISVRYTITANKQYSFKKELLISPCPINRLT